ncbi:MAG: NAD-dependent epimerase/dehydratase family protein, partial [Candidatus Neomarinimicrobiota bacterium]|nr:NAD-dependent epimerase/dehydratase family protein [Candidatus Neomarinimicrobiota bacterium]
MKTVTKKALVCGAGGFIGSHMVKKLKSLGYWVRGADIKYPEFSMSQADEFFRGDLTEQSFCDVVTNTEFDEIYQFAADMGGAGYIFTGEHDADVMNNSATINLNILRNVKDYKPKIFFSSSACMYPEHNQ